MAENKEYILTVEGKEKLEAEGLFDSSNKRPLVKYPKRIAVITSDTGAAVQDILNITASRYPACEIVMCPVLVQGDMAAQDMIKTLDRVYALENIDTVIIGRGGGSAEDLHCFNDEALARKIYAGSDLFIMPSLLYRLLATKPILLYAILYPMFGHQRRRMRRNLQFPICTI